MVVMRKTWAPRPSVRGVFGFVDQIWMEYIEDEEKVYSDLNPLGLGLHNRRVPRSFNQTNPKTFKNCQPKEKKLQTTRQV